MLFQSKINRRRLLPDSTMSPQTRVTMVAPPAWLLLAAALGCARPEPPPMRIALLAITEGQMAASSGQPSIEGAQLAEEEINAAGGIMIDGRARRVRVLLHTYNERPDAASSAAREAINLDRADAIVGPQLSSHAISAANVAEGAGVPLITPMASSAEVTAGRHFVFRLAFVDGIQGGLLAHFAFDSLRVRRPAVLFDRSSGYGRGIAQLFGATMQARGVRIVATETFVPDGGFDYRPQLRRLLASAPDAILLPNFAQQDSFQVRQARELGFRGRFLGTDRWDPVSLGKIPEVDGTVVVSNWSVKSDRQPSREFVARYERRFGHIPRSTAAATYDAVRLLADAARRANTFDGAELARAIGATSNFPGVVAQYRFRGTGDPDRGGMLLMFASGRDSLIFTAGPPE
jgi:branched-chain amino acid transport system substrate-binding protein